ncbi:MAG: YMGG-like glycine zipper-containing protein [Candidatus Nanoarchaeia archaeon]
MLFTPGCSEGITNNPKTDTAIMGAALGAAAGQAFQGHTEGTLWGAGIGALGGWMLGGQVEQQQRTQEEVFRMQGEMNTVTIWITNSNGSQIPIRLQKDGYGGYIGPRGERYNSLPTEAQLRMAYGF